MSERVDVVPSPLVGEGQGGGTWTAEFPLVGPACEAADLRRVFLSHGITSLPPMRLDERAWTFEITVPLHRFGARTLTVSQARPGHGLVSVVGESLTSEVGSPVMAQVLHVLSLDLDLTPFYAVVAEDAARRWLGRGAGRIVRSPHALEALRKSTRTMPT